MTDIVPQKDPKAVPPPRDPEGRMTFTAHLGELRTRMIHSLVAILVGGVVGYIFSEPIIDALRSPLGEISTTVPAPTSDATAAAAPATPAKSAKPIELMITTPFEAFIVKLKIAAYAGILLALPIIIFEVCAFVFPGLTATEKRIVQIMLTGGFGLAVAGVCVAYFGILRLAMPGLMQFVPEGVRISLKLSDTLSAIIKALLAFAMAFQMPMLVLVLVYIGVLTPDMLKAYRKVAIVGIFVFAAIFTPPDVISQIIMAIPMVLLYELSILVSYVVLRRKAKAAAAAEA